MKKSYYKSRRAINYRKKNRERTRQYLKSYASTPEGRAVILYHQNKLREKATGITPELFAALANFQKGCCAICNLPFASSKDTQADHCHDTKKPRGLLCAKCNLVEGLIKKIGLTPFGFADRLQRYLDNPPASILELV